MGKVRSFGLSSEEQEKRLKILRKKLKSLMDITQGILSFESAWDTEGEWYFLLVEYLLETYMYLPTPASNRPEKEFWTMSHLATERRRIMKEIEGWESLE